MKDQRVEHFRKLLESLVESLEADVRVARWEGSEAVPEPLQKCASRLVERLAAANRLAADHFVGSPAVVASLSAMSDAARRLDAAYIESRRRSGSPSHPTDAAMTLSREIDAVKDGPWR
jgi:hypothetical protein